MQRHTIRRLVAATPPHLASLFFSIRPGHDSTHRSERRRNRPVAFDLLEERRLLSTYTVNALTDTGAGSGTNGDLRYAITQANANAGSTIQFSVTGTIQLGSSLPNLSQGVTITGPGESSLTIQGGGTSSNYNALTVYSGVAASISGLTITGFDLIGNGGAIDNLGTLTISDSTITNDSAYSGGGIWSDDGTLTLSSDTISNDSATDGGGLWNGGTANIADTTLNGNSAVDGGGIYNANIMTLTNDNLSSNSASDSGGGIDTQGAATLSNVTLSDNSAINGGGGIYGGGTLSCSDSTISNNTAHIGGGISGGGTFTISGDKISGNSAAAGGGLYSAGGSSDVKLTDDEIVDNTVTGAGGGIYGEVTMVGGTLFGNSSDQQGGAIWNEGGLTVTGATIANNSAQQQGGAIFNSTGGTATLENDTLVNNSASFLGGAILNNATLTLFDDTVSDNSASTGGGIDNQNADGGSISLVNTIIAENTASAAAPDVDGTVASEGDNLIGQTNGSTGWISGGFNNDDLVGSTANPLNPLLSIIGNYGGPTETLALLPGSPAINAVSTYIIGAPTTDQRGVARPQSSASDIGAFESQGFTIVATSGAGQTALVGAAFSSPLVATVTAVSSVEPVAGGIVTFSAPANGASAGLGITNAATVGSNGQVSVAATANAITGQYTISASAAGAASPASFIMNNSMTLVVNTLADDPSGPTAGSTTLRDAITQIDAASTSDSYTISFSITGTINLTSALPSLTGNIDLDGPAASDLTVQRDSTAPKFSVFTVESGSSVTLSGMTIAGGSAINSGGGIYDLGTLTVMNSTFRDNSASIGFGGGIDCRDGILTVIGSTFIGNSSLGGGGVDGERLAKVTVVGSTFVDNSSFNYGGVANIDQSTMTVIDSTFTRNSATLYGGGFGNESVATVTGSTFSENSAEYGGGIAVETSAGELTVNNTIVAGNTSTAPGDNDISGQLQTTSAFNLIGDGSGISNLSGLEQSGLSNLIGTTAAPVNPLLAQLGDYGGPTQTMALRPGSPAIDAGSNALAVGATGDPLTTDQRGVGFARVVNGTVDIGAFESEGFTLSPVTDSTPQTASANSAFANPLTVAVSANNALEPVAGGTVTFSAPTTGATATMSPLGPVTIGTNGQASVMATANAVGGQYTVTASTAGASASSSFVLNNALTPLSQTISITTVASQTYGAAPITLSATATSGLPVGFKVLFGPATLSGSVLTITGSGTVVLLASQAGNAAYTAATPVVESFPVAPAQLTVTPTLGLAMVYGGAVPALTFTYTGLVNGDTIALITGSPATSATSSSNVGSYPITQGTLTASGNYVIGTFTSDTLKVNPAPLTVTAEPASRLYGSQDPTFAASISGFVLGQTLSTSGVAGSASFITSDVPGSPVGSYAITPGIGTLTAANYAFTVFNTGALSVTPAALTIAASPQTKTYGTTLTLGASAFTATGLQNGETVGSVTLMSDGGQAATARAGTYTIIPSAAMGGTFNASNYSITYNAGSLVVTPAILVISANSLTATAGDPIPVLTSSYSGFLNGDSPASLTTLPSITTTATTESPAGIYAITIRGASAPNYTITEVPGILTLVAPIPIVPTVTFVPTVVLATSIQTIKLTPHKTAKAIAITWSSALNAADALNIANFELSTVPSNKKQHPKPVAIGQTRYQPGSTSLLLLTRKPLNLAKPLKLTIISSGLLDASGNPVGGIANHKPGPNIIIVLTRSGATIQNVATT